MKRHILFKYFDLTLHIIMLAMRTLGPMFKQLIVCVVVGHTHAELTHTVVAKMRE